MGVQPRQPTREERAKGERHGATKLTWEQVSWARERYATGSITKRSLATELGVAQSTMGRIIRGEVWKVAR